MKRIAVLTSGGDAPGMNAHVRAVVKTAHFHGMEVLGIQNGYEGLIDNDFITLDLSAVGNIIQRGGTILRTSRSKRFLDYNFRKTAFENLQKHEIEGLILCGGNGTFTGGKIFYEEFKIPCIGTPGTIDNDLYGTDYTIGFDTALNTAIEAVDKIRDTAASHNRTFLIEVMGRDSGFIALHTGIASGAEAVFIPEDNLEYETYINSFEQNTRKEKRFSILVVAEGDEYGGAYSIKEKLQKTYPEMDIRVVILGHIQRGGNPSAQDRILASRLGAAAVEALLDRKSNVMAGIINNNITYTSFEEAISKGHNQLNPQLIQLAKILSV